MPFDHEDLAAHARFSDGRFTAHQTFTANFLLAVRRYVIALRKTTEKNLAEWTVDEVEHYVRTGAMPA